MRSRGKSLSFTAVLMSQLCFVGVAAAQDNTATAQPAAAPAAQPDEAAKKKSAEEEITVTGSRVRRKDLTTPAPVTVITREQIQSSGQVSLGDFLQTLPEQGNATNTTVNNGGDGTTNISLRSLGANRTLVLLDGKRFVEGGGGAGSTLGDAAVDLNSIPTSAVERVEILKDGASAVYGSDAIGGVVNIITRKRMNGTEVSAYYGTSQHGDARQEDVSLLSGISGDKGGFMFGLGYFNQDSMLAANRDWAKFALSYDYAGQVTGPGGSSRVPQGRARINPASCLTTSIATQNGTSTLCKDLQNAFGVGAKQYINTGAGDPKAVDGWRPYVAADAYNFQAVNYLITPSQRIQLFGKGDYQLTNFARAYFQASYVNRQSSNQLAPAPMDTGSYGVVIDAANAFNPFGVQISDARRRLIEGGGRQQGQDITTIRGIAGIDGTLPEVAGPLAGWYWDVSANFGRNGGTTTTQGSLNTAQVGNALGPSYRDANGVLQCGTDPTKGGTGPIANCTPANWFAGTGPLTPDMITALGGYTGINNGLNQMAQVEANVNGEIFRLAADRPASIAVGYSYRREYGFYEYNPVSLAGNDSDYNGHNTKGSYNLNEGYAELSLPIANNMQFIENLEAQAAIRVFNYSSFGSDFTYKFGGLYRPIRDVTVRGTYSTGFRAPGITSLYGGSGPNAESASDPCGATTDPTMVAQCNRALKRGGGTNGANNGDDNVQINSTSGGNALLQPEKANIFTAGIVIQPSFLRNLSITADYYNISITKTIGFITTPVILQGCYPGAGGTPNAAMCDLVLRGPNGQIRDVTDVLQNQGDLKTSGIDLAVRYVQPTEFGRFGFQFDSNFLLTMDQSLINGRVLHGVNQYDLGVNPTVKFNAGVSYAGVGALTGFNAGLRARFIGGFTECADPKGINAGFSDGAGLCSPDVNGAGAAVANTFPSHSVGAYVDFDLALSYLLKTSFGSTTFSTGIHNLLNTDPPGVYDTAASTNSDPSTYDYIGRFVYAQISQKF
jgi:iron complex outermembrane receptor protein